MPGKREDVISWDEFFMRAAVAASLRSKDPNTQAVSYTHLAVSVRIDALAYSEVPR